MKHIFLTLTLVLGCATAWAKPQATADKQYIITDFGAKPDGKTLSTKAIQKALDKCAAAGGGVVRVPEGRFLSGRLQIKSGTTLQVDEGAFLMASKRPEDYPALKSRYPDTGGNLSAGSSLLWAEGSSNIAVCGRGEIWGRPAKEWKEGEARPNIIHLRKCENVRIAGVMLTNACTWVQKYQSIRGLIIDSLRVESRENIDIEQSRHYLTRSQNGDGIDVCDCSDVRITHAKINSEDDAIVFKSHDKNQGCHNVVISDCVMTSNASGIKTGTETAGDFSDFTVTNCYIYNTRGAALAVLTADGSSIRRMTFNNIQIRNIKGSPIFVRNCKRNRSYITTPDGKPAEVSDIVFNNISATEAERFGCPIMGIRGAVVKNITLNNISIGYCGDKGPFYFENDPTMPSEDRTIDTVPEDETKYPRCDTFGKFPSYGFFIRHAENVTFNNVSVWFDRTEPRPVVIADDVRGLAVNNFCAQAGEQTPAVFQLRGVTQSAFNGVSVWGNDVKLVEKLDK